jgi:hypothetical protein
VSLDTLLTASGVSEANVLAWLNEIAERAEPFLLGAPVVRHYRIHPSETEGEYSAIDIDALGVTHILNGTLCKSDSADIVVTATVTPTLVGTLEVEQFAYARHGRHILIENGDADIVMKCICLSRTYAGLTPEMLLELKGLLFYAKSRDAESVFACLNRLSAIRRNAEQSYTHVLPRIKRTSYEITPWAL